MNEEDKRMFLALVAVRSGIYVARQMTKTAHGQQDFTPAARARLTYSP